MSGVGEEPIRIGMEPCAKIAVLKLDVATGTTRLS